tara:strand:- start:254 stop:1789 length:1536 start_codon:yes stop_codon:yes gene_type:complete
MADVMEETLELTDNFVKVPIPKDKPFSNKQNVIATVLGEARNQTYKGMQAVANVIDNRKKRSTSRYESYKDVVLASKQFDFWGSSANAVRNREDVFAIMKRKKKTPEYKNAEKIVNSLFKGELGDITDGADHFHGAPNNPPPWSQNMRQTKRLLDHVFLDSTKQATPSTTVPPISKEVAPAPATPAAPAAPILKKAEENSFVSKPSITENGEDTTTQDYPRPYGRIFPELMDKKTIAELTQQTGLDQHELWNKATESFIKFPNDLEKARLYFLKDMITDPKEGLNVNVITQENFSFTSKLNKKEGGLVPQYQRGTDRRGVRIPSLTVTGKGPISAGQNAPEEGGFLSVSGRHLKEKRKPVGEIITPERQVSVVKGSEDKGFSIKGRLPKNITNEIVKGLRLGGSFTHNEFKNKISADPFFNEVIREKVQSLGLNIGIKDKFDIRLNQTAIKPKGQKTRKQHSVFGEFNIFTSPNGKITVGINAEDFTGKKPRYSGSVRGRIAFEEGGFVSA